MEYLAGGTVKAQIAQFGAVLAPLLPKYARQILSALECALGGGAACSRIQGPRSTQITKKRPKHF